MKKYSILFFGGPIDVGGAGKILRFVANACSEAFGEVTIVSNGQVMRPENLASNIKFYSIIGPPREGIKYRIQLMKDIRRTIKSLSPDIVCVFDSERSVTARIATLGLNIKYASAERGDPYTLPTIWKLLTKICYGRSDACFFQLEGARDFYSKRVSKKSFVIPNPFILPEEVAPYDGKRNKTIVSAGRFVPEKGFDLLIKAFSIVNKIHPDYKLVIWGEGPLIQEYQSLISRLKIDDKVEFPGFSKNVAASVREEGIFVLSSHYEGIPNVMIEALSTGIPVVATDCTPGGPAYLADYGNRGIVIPKNDVNAMSEAVIRLIEDKELYAQFVQRGPHIREELDPKKTADKWISSFSTIIEKH